MKNTVGKQARMLNTKKYSIAFGIGVFYLLGGGFIFAFDNAVIIPFIQWVKELSLGSLSWYLELWARISVLIGAIIIFITTVVLRVKKASKRLKK